MTRQRVLLNNNVRLTIADQYPTHKRCTTEDVQEALKRDIWCPGISAAKVRSMVTYNKKFEGPCSAVPITKIANPAKTVGTLIEDTPGRVVFACDVAETPISRGLHLVHDEEFRRIRVSFGDYLATSIPIHGEMIAPKKCLTVEEAQNWGIHVVLAFPIMLRKDFDLSKAEISETDSAVSVKYGGAHYGGVSPIARTVVVGHLTDDGAEFVPLNNVVLY